MTPQEIHNAIDQGLQILSSFVYANFLPEEVDLRFNRCVDTYIDKYLQPRLDLRGVDGVQRGVDALDQIKVEKAPIPLTNYVGVLPTDYRNLLAVYAEVTDSCGTRIVGCRLYGQEHLAFVRKSPFAKSNIESPIYSLYGDSIKLDQGSDFSSSRLIIDYIKIPVPLDFTIVTDWKEFPDFVIKDIIDLTIEKLLEETESERLNNKISIDNQQKL